MRRAMNVLEGSGPQETASDFHHPFDHPYFGQLFLAGIFKIIGYPDSLNPVEGDVNSIERLWLVPRILMGLLAVVDTFLIYKIAERRYNRNVAFIASILFAVMPLGWMVRNVFLESIQMPFLLTSIFLAVYYSCRHANKISGRSNSNNFRQKNDKDSNRNIKNTSLILLSGAFLGLAIFTKIPVFTMIPLVGFLIYTNSNRNLKSLGLWFIPVILIPLIWPIESIWQGQFEEWIHDALWQTTGRVDKGVFEVFKWLFQADPVLLVVGISGSIFAGLIKRDFLALIWLIPLVMLFHFLGYTQPHFFIVALPAFCISGAILIGQVLSRIKNKKLQQVMSTAIISGVLIFGLASTIVLISLSVNHSYFEAVAFVVHKAKDSSSNNDNSHNAVSILGFPRAKSYLWIPKYIFDKDVRLVLFRNVENIERLQVEKFIIITNNDLESYLSKEKNIQSGLSERIKTLYNDSETIVKFVTDNYNFGTYPYTNMKDNYAGLLRPVEIRAN